MLISFISSQHINRIDNFFIHVSKMAALQHPVCRPDDIIVSADVHRHTNLIWKTDVAINQELENYTFPQITIG